MNTNVDLPELLSRIRQGDESALAEFLRHYELPLRRAAHALMSPAVRSNIDSMDLVQSVYRGMLARLRDGQHAPSKPDDFLALALTAIRNKLISNWRRSSNEDRRLRTAALLRASEARGSSSSNPASVVEQRDLVNRLFDGLAPMDRQLVEWQLIGLTPTEMAAKMGCDAHALRARLSRLRAELRRRNEHRLGMSVVIRNSETVGPKDARSASGSENLGEQ